MALRLPHKWLWDFWLARDGPDYHLFYLQAPRALGDPDLRHWHVSIGHAVSQDLREWQILPDALEPGPAGAWDDYTTWTGSIICHQGRWHLFYTGSNRAEKGLLQRIGLATSDDLVHWQRHPDNPLLAADPRWYELLNLELWHDQAWRDPWVFRHPQSGDFHALITARVNYGPADERGVVGHARSSDLLRWEVLPPLTEPGEYGHLEVPQLTEIEGRYYLLFSVPDWAHAAARGRRTGNPAVTGTHYLVGENPLGPFRSPSEDFLVGDTIGSFYAAKLVRGPDERWVLLATRRNAPDGSFSGELSDPLPVEIDGQGRLVVAWQEEV